MHLPKEVIGKVFSAIFGSRGLIKAENQDDFTGRRLEFEAKYGRFFKTHKNQKYIDTYLDRILRNVLNPSWVSQRIGLMWDNNDAECYNR